MATLDPAIEELRGPLVPTAALFVLAVLASAGGAAFGVAAVVGASISPVLPVVGVIGVASFPFIVLRPRLALGVLVATEVSAAGDILASTGVPGVGNAVLLLAVGSAVLAVRRREARFTWSPVYLTLILFIAARAVTVLLAPDPGHALANIGDVVRATTFLVVIAVLASVPGGIKTLVAVALGVMAVLGGLAVAQEFVIGNSFDFFGFSKVPKGADIGAATERHSGPLPDANFWARALGLFLPLAISLWAAATGRWRQLLWIGGGLLIVAGIYLTGSRGGLLTIGVCVVVWMVFAGPRSRRLLLLVPTLAVLVLLLPGVGTRLSSLAEISQASEEAGDASLVARLAVQRQGFRMFLDNPAIGVGAANFEEVGSDYIRESGLTVRRDIAPHNLYLEMAAEGGIAGLASWLIFYGSACWLALRALLLRLDARPTDRLLDRLLPVGVLAGLLGWAFASIFLHLANIRILFIVIGVAIALDARARRLATSTVRIPSPKMGTGTLGHFAAIAGVGLVVFVLVAALLGARETSWQATSRARVAVPESSGADGHDESIATRGVVKSTAAALLASEQVAEEAAAQAGIDLDDLELTATASTTSTALTVTASTDDAASAVVAATTAIAGGERIGAMLGPRLEIRGIDAPVRAKNVASYDLRALTDALLAALTVSWLAVAARWLSRTRAQSSLATAGG